MAPVEFLHVVSAKGVDHACNGRRLALAAEVKVKHALHSLGVHTVEEGACLLAEEGLVLKRRRKTDGVNVRREGM